MKRSILTALLCVVMGFTACSEGPRPLRMCAEWEPALGTMIVWPLKIPSELVRLLAKDEIIFVLVAYDEDERRARTAFDEWGIDPDHVQFIRTSVESEWTRDYGAQMVFDETGSLTIVDPVYIDTPVFYADNPEVKRGEELLYPGRYPGDDRTNHDVAAYLGHPLRSIKAFLTGGNFLVDGFRSAFMTRAMVDENNTRMSDDEFFEIVWQATGVETIHVLHNTEPFGIQHIDCWLKILDEETLLVKRAPEDHPEYEGIERNLERIRQLKTRYGRPWEILRIDCPPFGTEPDFITKEEMPALPAYTNSLILNRSVLVPLFGGPGDDQAINTYEKAMPGYSVHGILWDQWHSFDALHCRTRAVFDAGMLRMSHARVRSVQPADRPIVVNVEIEAYSRARLIRDELTLNWRRRGGSEWNQVQLQPAEDSGGFAAEIPTQAPDTWLEYYLTAADHSGRRESLPRTAPAGFYSFSTVATVSPG